MASIYGIPTHRLNEAVKRNRERFPEDFMFQLNQEEQATLTSQIAMSKRGRGGRRTLSYSFTVASAAANTGKARRSVFCSESISQ